MAVALVWRRQRTALPRGPSRGVEANLSSAHRSEAAQ